MNYSWSQYKEKINDNLRYHYIYRGQSNPSWLLLSSFARFCKKNNIKYSLDTFGKLLKEFEFYASEYLNSDLRNMSMCNLIALSQHHLLPTPFLDWSESPYIAAFFAFESIEYNDSPSSVSVWAYKIDNNDIVFDDYNMNFSFGDPPEFCIIKSRLFSSKRIFRQKGCFSFLNRDCDLEKYLLETQNNNRLIKYNISISDRLQALKELSIMGVTKMTLFDSLDAVSTDVCIKLLNE